MGWNKHPGPAWYQRFADFVAGFSHSKSDNSLFIYQHGTDTAYILLYVDDIILTASTDSPRHRVTPQLGSGYEGLGSIELFFGYCRFP